MLLITIQNSRASGRRVGSEVITARDENDFARRMIGRAGWRRLRTVSIPDPIEIDVNLSELEGPT